MSSYISVYTVCSKNMKPFYTQQQLDIISVNLKRFLSYSKKKNKVFAKEIGVTNQTVSEWVLGRAMKPNTLSTIALQVSKWVGVNINPDDFLMKGFADNLTTELGDSSIQHDPSYTRTPLSVEEFISKNKKAENIDENDEAFLLGLYSRGSKLEKVSERSLRNMLHAFRENLKEERTSDKK